MRKNQQAFKLSRMAVAVMLATASAAPFNPAFAGVGFGDGVDQAGNPVRIPTYFANSPRGTRDVGVPEASTVYTDPADPRLTSTGRALRKFVDPLPLPGVAQTMADGVTQRTIPVARTEKWITPQGVATNDDYVEVAVVEYTMRFHSDLAKETTMRGYVQLVTPGLAAQGVTGIALTYPDGTPIMINETDAWGRLTGNKVQARGVQKPEFLGPVIVATKGVPTRMKFVNLLPPGRAEIQKDAAGNPVVDAFGKVVVAKRNGDIFLPVDPSYMGAGIGPDGMSMFSQNRAVIHLHGGDTPWISDGTPHQWITPAAEADPAVPGSLASEAATGAMDSTYLPNFLRGAGAVNVPDMADPGPGAMTYYFPNGQSARMLWYHDHTSGLTRLNVYAGEAAGYLLTDSVEQDLIARGVLPPAARTIPLVVQDRTFVPDDIALQDAKWNTSAWGAPGDSWFPHVYETVQDPAQLNNWNAVGRWHYGPYFWPVFPALYPLPSGEYGDATGTPEAWMDTGIVNGTAYPYLEVDPTTYRFRLLNASNDRVQSFNFFVATNVGPDGTPSPALPENGNGYTEVAMVPAAVSPNQCPVDAAGVELGNGRPVFIDPTTKLPVAEGTAGGVWCTPSTWPIDNRAGGVPDPAVAGPSIYQFASEGGLMPQVATINPTPVNYILDKGRITVLNVDTPALNMGPAERADFVVDFSKYAGKTLIVYNDSGAPVPAGDPRNDYFTGVGDQSASGGAEDTKPGYGPNTRTLMQIRVRAALPDGSVPAPYDPTPLMTEIPKAYAASQERPIVGQSAYNTAFGESWNDASGSFASIYVGSLKEPQFKFTPGTPSAAFNSVIVTQPGTGYVTAPRVVFSDATSATEAGATAQATLKIDKITVTNSGSGYTLAPTVSIVAQGGGGSGATATVGLGVVAINVTNGGSGYTTAPVVNFSVPPAGGVRATGTATVANGRVVGITITNPGSGYAAAPTVSIAAPVSGVKALATVDAGVMNVNLVAPDPANPNSAGGGGYTDLTQVAFTFTPPQSATGTLPQAFATGRVFDVTMINAGTGYTGATQVSFDNTGAFTADATITKTSAAATTDTLAGLTQGSILVKTKAIQELFDSTYGRLNATLGVEIPFTSALTQTTIPLGYIDTPTEKFEDGETQIWKITHNGVDTHPVHFHLLNVQLINRVGWDGFISPPAPNEVGWKETVKMNPLEDVIVAVRAKKPATVGFGLPNSVRLLDPTQPLGSPFGFTQIDANTGNPATVVNQMFNFGWEYVWHCHILGHEENDFMRPIVFDAKEAPALAPTITAPANGTNYAVGAALPALTWTDNAQTEYQYLVERSVNSAAYTTVATLPANATTYTDAGYPAMTANTSIEYRVTAVGANGAGSAITKVQTAAAQLESPTNLVSLGVTSTSGGRPRVTLNWTDASINEGEFRVYRKVTGSAAAPIMIGTVTRTASQRVATGGTASFVDGNQATNRPVYGTSYDYYVVAATAAGAAATVSAPTPTLTVRVGTTATPFAAAPTVTSAGAYRLATSGFNANIDVVSLIWNDESSNSNTNYAARYRVCQNTAVPCASWGGWNNASWTGTVPGANGTAGSFRIFNFIRNRQAEVQLRSTNAIGNSTWSASNTVVLP